MSLLLISTFIGFNSPFVLADPEDCMSKEEAENLIKNVKKEKYIMDYCDCCAELDPSVTANLLLITKLSIVPCEYDSESFSVKIETQTVASFLVIDQQYTSKTTFNANPINYALLNYQYYYTDGVALRLGYIIRVEYDAPDCSGLNTFPDPNLVNDKKYKSWYKKH